MAESREMMPQSKRQKLDEAEKDPVVYFDSKRIPIEVWESIFLHNSAGDLLNLSLVCKKFYNAIGSLPEAMEKIVVKQGRKTEKDKNSLLNSSRNFKNFKFERIEIVSDMKICLKIIKKFGENLTSLEFYWCQFIEEEFNKILEMSQKNLKSLTMYNLELKETTRNKKKAAASPIKLTKLKSLKIPNYNDTVLIKNVLDCATDTLLELVCEYIFNGIRFVKFLERQKNLKHFTLISSYGKVLEKISSAQFNFKLEKLETDVPNSIEINKNFATFLTTQAESLKELTLKNVSILKFYDLFTYMPNLQFLKFEVLDSIATVFANGPNFDCPALKSLEINFFGGNSDVSYLNFFKKFATLPEIVLKMPTNSSMMKIISENHPNLKSLVIHKFNDDSFKSVPFKNLPQLEIYGRDFTDINMEYSIFAMENLRILKIRSGFYVTMRSLLLILFNSKKLEHLEIDNYSYLSDISLCRHLEIFKNLRFLKICKLREPVENFIECLTVYPDLKYSFSSGSWSYHN